MIARLAAPLLCLLLSACAGSAKTYYYTLQPLPAAAIPPSASKPRIASIAIAGLQLPELVDRPQLVLRQGDAQLLIDDSHQWGQTLKREILDGLARQLTEDGDVGQVFLPGQTGKENALATVTLDILRYDSILGGAAILEARWTLQAKSGGPARTGHALLREDANGASPYDALVLAHRRALARLSRQLFADIAP